MRKITISAAMLMLTAATAFAQAPAEPPKPPAAPPEITPENPPPPPAPPGPRGPDRDRRAESDRRPPPPPRPHERGARIHLESGQTRLDIRCHDRESTRECGDVALSILDRLQKPDDGEDDRDYRNRDRDERNRDDDRWRRY